MKNIITKLGSKKVIGAVLVMVTLVVGLGVVSNFSGSNQKAANEAALSKFNDNAYNDSIYSSSASRRDLERQMSAQQDKNTARFLRGKSEGIDEDDAWSSDGAYGEGVRNGEGFVYGDAGSQGGQGGVNGAYDPSNPMYAQAGGVDENGVPYGEGVAGADTQDLGVNGDGMPYGAKGANAGYGAAGGAGSAADKAGANGQESSAAAKAAKAKRDRERANKLRRATQINKLAASGGGSSWGSSVGGQGGAGAMSMGGNNRTDNATRALPSTNAAKVNDANADAFKFGRGGTMGGYNTARGNSAGGNNSKDGSRTAINSMLYANNASIGATKKIAEGAKSLAEDAFLQDGGNDGGALIDTGATIREAVAELDRAGSNGGDQPSFDGLGFDSSHDEQAKTLEGLQQDLTNAYLKMILGTLGISLVVWLLAKMSKIISGWVGALFLFAALLTALAGIVFVLSMREKMMGIIEDIKSPDLDLVNQEISKAGMTNCANVTSIIMGLLLPTAVILGLTTSFGNGVVSLFRMTGFIGVAAEGSAIGASVLGSITSIVSLIGSLVGVGAATDALGTNQAAHNEKAEDSKKKKEGGGN